MVMRRITLAAERINAHLQSYSLFDVGCRTMVLKPYLTGCTQYVGSDKTPGENVLECNLENGLPAGDKSFDVTVALDVLEHLENFHGTFKDMMRVARKLVVVSLPNMSYVGWRVRYLLGYGLGGKYDFLPTPWPDRHRWVLSYNEAVEFMRVFAAGHPVETIPFVEERGRMRYILGPIEKFLARVWPNLFAYGVMFVIRVDK
jgi:hypothetical protein